MAKTSTSPEAEDGAPATEAGGRTAVVAGGGSLPIAVARSLARNGANPFVVLIEGEVEDELAYAGLDPIVMPAEELLLLLPRLKKANVDRLVMAGTVTRRPKFSRVRWGPSILALLPLAPRIARALSRGDDSLLRTLIGALEGYGIKVVGVHEIVTDLLAPAGILTRAGPNAADRRDIDAASEAALAIGRLDIGQAAVAIGGRVIALEGIEGTDGLLTRTAALRGHGRLAGKSRGVLVKRCKPQQELRADLPAIGPDTIDAAHAAGLVGVAVEAGRSLILDFAVTVERADEKGIFVIGLEPGTDER